MFDVMVQWIVAWIALYWLIQGYIYILKTLNQENMETIFHFLKHLLGLCGEPHPSLLFGGAGVVGYCVYCFKVLTHKLRKKY